MVFHDPFERHLGEFFASLSGHLVEGADLADFFFGELVFFEKSAVGHDAAVGWDAVQITVG